MFALRFEHLKVVCGRLDYGAVDGDVGLDGVAGGVVDVEGEEGGALVDCAVVGLDEGLRGWQSESVGNGHSRIRNV